MAIKKLSPKSQIFLFSKIAKVNRSSKIFEKGLAQGVATLTADSRLIPIHLQEKQG